MTCLPFIYLYCVLSVFYTVQAQPDHKSHQPFFTNTPTNATYFVGDTATLKCGVRYRGSKTVTWIRLHEETPLTLNTYSFTGNKRISSTHNKFRHEWNLHIENLKMSDMGVYECKVSTLEVMVKHFFLNVVERQARDIPKPGVVISGTEVIEVGQPLSLTCNATGLTEAPQDVEWFKDSERVESNSRSLIEISKFRSPKQRSLISYLVVERSRIKDSGRYLCRSSKKTMARIQVQVINAATFNVKRGTEKNHKLDNSGRYRPGEDNFRRDHVGNKPDVRGTVKKQLGGNGGNKGYYSIQPPADNDAQGNTHGDAKGDKDSRRQEHSQESPVKGISTRLSPFSFHTFVTIILLILLQCKV